MATPNSTGSAQDIADKAVSLAAAGAATNDRAQNRATLIALAGDAPAALEQARELLVRRIRMRSDDFSATYGLSLLNTALSQLGKRDDVQWQPKKWKLPR